MSLYSQNISNNPLSLDGLITGQFDAVYINGQPVSANSVPYSGATGNVDLNNKNLTNINTLAVNTSLALNIPTYGTFSITNSDGTKTFMTVVNSSGTTTGGVTSFYGGLQLYDQFGGLRLSTDAYGNITLSATITANSGTSTFYNFIVNGDLNLPHLSAGFLSVNSSGIVTSSSTPPITQTATSTNAIFYPLFSSTNTTGTASLYVDSFGRLKYNASTSSLSSTNMSCTTMTATGTLTGDSLTLTSLLNGFLYMGGTGIASIVQAIFKTGTTSDVSPNLLLAGGGAFQISDTGNTQSYFAVTSAGISASLPITLSGSPLFFYYNAGGNMIRLKAQKFTSYPYTITDDNGQTFITFNTSITSPPTQGNMLINTAINVADPTNTEFYFQLERGRQRWMTYSGTYGYYTWGIDGLNAMTLNTSLLNVVKPCTMTSLTINSSGCNLSVNGIGSIYTGNRFMPVTGSYMSAGSLCIGSYSASYGGGTGTSNIAGFILETQNGGNQEIAIHDYGATVKSFMYYSGAEQRIYLGRDMGNGWGACSIAVRSNLTSRVVSTASANYISFYNQGGNATSFIGCENASGTGLFGSGFAYGLSLGTVNDGAIGLFQSNSLINTISRGGGVIVYNMAAGYPWALSLGGTQRLRVQDDRVDITLSAGQQIAFDNSKFYTNRPIIVQANDSSLTTYGPNSTWGAYLKVGSGPYAGGYLTASITSTNGNNHIDAGTSGNAIYLNYYNAGYMSSVTYYWGSFSYGSDERYKENIITADNELCYNNIKKIRIVRYNFTSGDIFERCTGNDKKRLGVLAQELETVFPKSVTETEDPETKKPFKAIDTRQMYYTLVGCVQELQNRVETLTTKCNKYEEQITVLQSQNDLFMKQLIDLTNQMNELTKKIL